MSGFFGQTVQKCTKLGIVLNIIIMVLIMAVGRDLGMRGLDESPSGADPQSSTFPDHGHFVLESLEERRLTIKNYLKDVRLVNAAEERVFSAYAMHRDFVKLSI